MSKYYTTLKALRDNDACEERYDCLVSKIGNTRRRIGLDEILKHNGIADAIWALCAVKFTKKYGKDWHSFKADCAEMVLENFEKFYPDDDRPRKAIETARNINATDKERKAAMSAAWSAAWSAADSVAMYAAMSAAMSAAWSAADSAAMYAAMSAADSAERKKQKKLFIKYFC